MATLEQEVELLQRNKVPEKEIASFIQNFKPSTPDPAISTITTKPEPTEMEKGIQGKNIAAGTARFGIPIATAIATGGATAIPQLVIQALAAGGSEIAARKMERVESDPEIDTMMSDLKAGGVTGLLDAGVNLITRGMGAGFRRIGRKIFIPSEIPLEVQIAQETLGNIPPQRSGGKGANPVQRFLEWVGTREGKRPFSLTAGQINAEEQRFITWLEGVARGGIFSRGRMAAFDTRNKEAIGDIIQNYIETRAAQSTAPEFALLVNRTIGNLDKQGEIFTPVVAMRKYLYKQFDDGLREAGGTIDGTALRNYINKSGGMVDDLPTKIYNNLRREGLVPPLKAPSTSKRTITNVNTRKISEETIDKTQDLTKTNLLTGDETRIADATIGTKASSTKGTSQTVRESETIAGITEEELIAEWENLPATDVDKIIRIINSEWKDGDDSINNTLKFMRRRIEDPFLKYLDTVPNLRKLHGDANSFFSKEATYLRNKTIKGLRKAASENPSKILHMLGGDQSDTGAKVVYDKLMDIKKGFGFASEVATDPVTKRALASEWDNNYLNPIRYDMITKHIDKFGYLDSDGFLKEMNKNASLPEFMNEIFGGPEKVEQIKKLMTTLSVLKKEVKGQSVLIQLLQGGAIGGALGGGMEVIFSDGVDFKGTGTAAGIGAGSAILLGPSVLAKMLTNPELMRGFTDGLSGGIRSGKFSMALRKIAQMKYASSLMRENPSAEKTEFYSKVPQRPVQ